jgi:hypothetical protein
MSDEEAAAAIAVSGKNPQVRAFLQLIADYETAAALNVGADFTNATTITWNAGGSDKIKQFKEWFLELREMAQTEARRDPVKFKRVTVASGMRDSLGRKPEEEEE